MDDAPVRGLRLGRGDERALPLPARARADGALGRLRPADAARLRLRRSARGRRGRAHRRRDRLARRHADAPRRDPARRGLDVDDDQRAGRRCCCSSTSSSPRSRASAATALRGTVQNDILKEYVARGNYIFPPRPSMRLTTDLFAYCAERIPRWNTISISGYHIREAGSTAVQELAFTLANGIAYCRGGDRRRASRPTTFGARLSFFFNAHNDFFQEVAKFRAARRLWAPIMRDRFGATNPRALALRFHAQTGGSTLTAQQPENNIVRVAIQALSAVCRRRAVPAHERLRRGARAADRALGADRAAHAAAARARGRRHRHGRSARRLLLRRGAHRGARGAGARADRARRRARRRGRGDRAGLRPARDRGGRVPLHDARSSRASGSSSASTGSPSRTREQVELHRLDPEGEARQIGRTKRVRAERDADAAEARSRRYGGSRPRDGQPAAADARGAPRARARSARSASALREEFGTYDAQR